MTRTKQLQMTGFLTFAISGICVISCGIIVNRLQVLYGFS